jgi:cysteine desulfurase family protein
MIYLDNAATSHPKPEAVYAAMDRCAREVGANPGRSGHRMAVQAEGEIAVARRAVAALLGGRDPLRLIFTLNATDALNMAIKGILRRGDHVVTTVLEHNSVSRPLTQLEKDGVITVTRVKPSDEGVIDPDDITQAMSGATRLVAMAHASNVLGAVHPIEPIGRAVRERGKLLLVDAAQSAGVVPLDIERGGIDLLAFAGHKGLLGPTGTGGLYVGERAELRPWREGGTGGSSAEPLQPEGFPHHLEAGTPNTAGIAGLAAGARYVAERGVESLGAHERQLALRLWEALADDNRIDLHGPAPMPAAPRTGVVSLQVRGHEPEEVAAILDTSFSIAVRAGLHCAPGAHRFLDTFPSGTVRVSPGPFNTIEEIDALVAALREIAA